MEKFTTPFGSYFYVRATEDRKQDFEKCTFLVDVSCSMYGPRLKYVKSLLAYLLENWQGNRELIPFSDYAEPVIENFSRHDVMNLECKFGTNFFNAFTALDGESKILFFITDGETDIRDICMTATIFGSKNVRQMHCICVADGAGLKLLNKLKDLCCYGSFTVNLETSGNVFNLVDLVGATVELDDMSYFADVFYPCVSEDSYMNVVEFKNLPPYDQRRFLKKILSEFMNDAEGVVTFRERLVGLECDPGVLKDVEADVENVLEIMEGDVRRVLQKRMLLGYNPSKKIKYVERRTVAPHDSFIKRYLGLEMNITKLDSNGKLEGLRCISSLSSPSEAHNNGDVMCMGVKYHTDHQASWFHPHLVDVEPTNFFITFKTFMESIKHVEDLNVVPNIGVKVNGVIPLFVNEEQWTSLGKLYLRDSCSMMASGQPGEGCADLSAKIIPMTAWIKLYVSDYDWASRNAEYLKDVILNTWEKYEDVSDFMPAWIKAARLALEDNLSESLMEPFAKDYFHRKSNRLPKCYVEYIYETRTENYEQILKEVREMWSQGKSAPNRGCVINKTANEESMSEYFDVTLQGMWSRCLLGKIFKRSLGLDNLKVSDKFQFLRDIGVVASKTRKEGKRSWNFVSDYVIAFLEEECDDVNELAAKYNAMNEYDMGYVRRMFRRKYDYPNYKKKLVVNLGHVMRLEDGYFVQV